MALSLLQICTRAIDGVSGFNVPLYIFNNTDDTAKTLLAGAYKVGEELVRDYDWQELTQTETITTVDGTKAYDLESDYERMSSDTMWDADQYEPIKGHTSRRRWAALTNSQVNTAGTTYFFRLKNNQIQIDPTPSSAFDISYEYISNIYCKDSLSVDRADGWAADTDLPKLPQDLFILGIRYYFSDSKTLPRAPKYGAEYYSAISSRQKNNVPSEVLNLSEGVLIPGTGYANRINIPEQITDY